MKEPSYNTLEVFLEKVLSLGRSAEETAKWSKKAAEVLKKELREAEAEDRKGTF